MRSLLCGCCGGDSDDSGTAIDSQMVPLFQECFHGVCNIYPSPSNLLKKKTESDVCSNQKLLNFDLHLLAYKMKFYSCIRKTRLE